jgi:hypothetical protein
MKRKGCLNQSVIKFNEIKILNALLVAGIFEIYPQIFSI